MRESCCLFLVVWDSLPLATSALLLRVVVRATLAEPPAVLLVPLAERLSAESEVAVVNIRSLHPLARVCARAVVVVVM